MKIHMGIFLGKWLDFVRNSMCSHCWAPTPSAPNKLPLKATLLGIPRKEINRHQTDSANSTYKVVKTDARRKVFHILKCDLLTELNAERRWILESNSVPNHACNDNDAVKYSWTKSGDANLQKTVASAELSFCCHCLNNGHVVTECQAVRPNIRDELISLYDPINGCRPVPIRSTWTSNSVLTSPRSESA